MSNCAAIFPKPSAEPVMKTRAMKVSFLIALDAVLVRKIRRN